MIKTVKKIGIKSDLYPIPITIFEFLPIFQDKYQYLSGAFYGFDRYPQVALYYSTEDGIILTDNPIILEEGIPTFDELFKFYGYTLVD